MFKYAKKVAPLTVFALVLQFVPTQFLGNEAVASGSLSVVQIAASSSGSSHTCALLSDNTLRCWGYNSTGQLGLGDINARGDNPGEMSYNLPQVNIGVGTISRVEVGGSFSCVLMSTGSVRCWGANTYGQLGLGDTNNRGDGPNEMGASLQDINFGTAQTVVELAVGGYHGCALFDDNTVRCWGFNLNGQLGLGDVENRGDDLADTLLPIDLGTSKTILHLSLGFRHSCVLFYDGSVKCWGSNGFGNLGQADETTRGDDAGEMGTNLPYVNFGTGVLAAQISAGQEHTCIVTTISTVKCWGNNRWGQSGSSPTTEYGRAPGTMGDNLPTVASSVNSISSGSLQTCVIYLNGLSSCWGGVVQGGSIGYADVRSITGRGTFTEIAQGYGRACALNTLFQLYCWGSNSFGESGLGYTSSAASAQIFLFDLTSPTISRSSFSQPNAGTNDYYRAGATIILTVNFDEDVIAVGSPAIWVRIGTSLRRFVYLDGSADSIRFSYMVTTSDNDADGISIPRDPFDLTSEAAIKDLAGNNADLTYSGLGDYPGQYVDTTAATAIWTAPSSPSTSRSLSFALVFNESITGLQSSDIANSGTALNCTFSVGGSTSSWTVLSVCGTDGTVIPKLLLGTVLDLAGNPSPDDDVLSASSTMDTLEPTLIWSTRSGTSASRTLVMQFELSEIATGVALSDFSNTGTAVGCTMTLAGGDLSWTITAVCSTDGTFVLAFAKNGMTDAAGNIGPSAILLATSITIDTTPDPPNGEIGMSINEGGSYTNDRNVNLFIVWPKGATGMKISNDGGFSPTKTTTVDAAKTQKWILDDSVLGLYTKIVYLRFVGSNIDASKTYSDDIILDSAAPIIESITVVANNGSVDFSLKAVDDVTGVDKIEVKRGVTIVAKVYATKFSLTENELGMTALSPNTGISGSSSIGIRVVDRAGNWSEYKTLSLPGAVAAPTVATPTVATPTVSKTKSATASSIARYAKLTVLSTSKVTLKVVSSYAKYCKVSGTTLKGLKAGTCKVTVTVTPKKGRATFKTVTLKIAG